jgi:hypothetical protein
MQQPDSSAEPVALARLIQYPLRGNVWRVDVCPLCGKSHEHSAGPLDGEPRAALGPRNPPCHRAPSYVLTERPSIRRTA